MFRRIPVISLVLVGMLVAAGPALAIRKSGSTSAAFLKIPVGSRQAALGTATTVLKSDINQAFVNPAGIALNTGQLQLAYTYNQWIADLAHNSVAIGYGLNLPVMGEATIGLSGVFLGKTGIPADRDNTVPPLLDKTQITVYDPNTSASYDFSEYAIGLSVGKRFTDKLDLGATLKLIGSNIDDVTASAIAIDFGAVYDVGYNGLSVGARINNLGSDMQYIFVEEALPLTFTIGAGIDLVNKGMTRLRSTIDAARPQDQAQLLNAGLEYSYGDAIQIRGGYKFNYSGARDNNDQKITEEGVSFGAGIKLPLSALGLDGITPRLDYTYTDFNLLGNVHRFTFNFQWQ